MLNRPTDILPGPSPDAAQHSADLTEFILSEIADQGGWISFASYMNLALYTPGMGYYTVGTQKFGEAGDFVTAPEISPLFGRTVARQIAEIMRCSVPHVLELGAGSGMLAADILSELERLGTLPESYGILEVSSDLRARQQELLRQRIPNLFARISWLDAIPGSVSGAIIANEVLDALPVHLVHWHDGTILERGVAAHAGNLVWKDRPITDGGLLAAVRRIHVRADYISEVGLAAAGLVNSLARNLNEGAMLFIDYGFGAREFYHPQRNRGTLMCHYRHHSHDDPFLFPGLQDITAHVNFSDIAECGLNAGLDLLGYTTQAFFLINCGISELLQEIMAKSPDDYWKGAAELHKLTSPAEMGELFKVISLGKFHAGVSENQELGKLLGFTHGDMSRLL